MDSIWIARDENGLLHAFKEKPTRIEIDNSWACELMEDDYFVLSSKWFSDLRWQDEPVELAVKK